MTLLTPLALIALALLPLIVALHVRRRRYQQAEVPSLAIWREVAGDVTVRSGRLSIPAPLLLLLQLLAVAVLALSLARPQGAATAGGQQIYVLDDSYRMAATDVAPTRLAVARRAIEQRIDRAPAGTRFTVVLATAQPTVLIDSGDRAQVRRALDAVRPTAAEADLPDALRLAAGTLRDPRGRAASALVAYAREDALPAVSGTLASFEALPIGHRSSNQALVRFSARCTAGARATCMAYAAVRNEDDRAATVPVVVDGDGAVLAERTLQLPAASDTSLSFPIPGAIHALRIYIAQRDVLPLDNAAWAIVPVAARARVTLVGDAGRVAPIKQALAALPDVQVRVLPPSQLAAARRAPSTLLILDGVLPAGALPPVPSLLLIDPPRLPGGSVSGALSDTTLSGVDVSSPLVATLDLTSLDVAPGAAERLTLPSGIAPVVWSAGGPLFAAGVTAGQRLAVLAFDPARSNLPQLSAFPVLLRQVLQWSAAWLPPSAAAGDSIVLDAPPGTRAIQIASAGLPGAPALRQALQPTDGGPVRIVVAQPGLYSITERGAWGTRTGALAVNLNRATTSASAATGAISFGSSSSQATSATTSEGQCWWPWIGLVALALIVAEWLYVVTRRERSGSGSWW